MGFMGMMAIGGEAGRKPTSKAKIGFEFRSLLELLAADQERWLKAIAAVAAVVHKHSQESETRTEVRGRKIIW